MKVNQDKVNDAVDRIIRVVNDLFADPGYNFNVLEINDVIAVLATRLATCYLEHVKNADQAISAFQRLVGMKGFYKALYAPPQDDEPTQLLM